MDFVDRAPLSLDRDRVTCLLLINTHLMKKCSNMYTNVICNQSLMQQMSNENRANITQSYANYIKRLQCNLTTLNYIYEKYHGQSQQQGSKSTFPVVLSAPPDMPELFPLYAKLQELYAEALQFLRMKMEEMRKQQMFQQQSGAGGVSGAMGQFQQPPLPPQQQQQQQQQQPNAVPQQSQLNIQQQGQPLRQQSLQQQIKQQQQPQPQSRQQQQPPLSASNNQFQQPFDDMLLADTFTNSQAPSGMNTNTNVNMNMGMGMGTNMNPNTTNTTNNMGVDFANHNFSNDGGLSNGSNFQISTLSPQQILQQANEAKSNNSGSNTPHLNSNEFGIF
ncbi:hypothetical protein CORT_0A08300 [Candida orthopsilosis Co 90-125]|uniref:Uncharacterized protein n=1 Tax=Candida orthopsilosis (strain 90-125) TaxID=1136231 RepID=H8WYA0_CANO9|nr:hypothetical protein CORT_0A08300 [Candida orthopsilosis Co 90-125]CCG21215.1 hypothetical protein CORT_0A08300 [Candida orthopsilosis Co 90-125]